MQRKKSQLKEELHHILENTQQLSRTLKVDNRSPTKEEAQQHRLDQTRSEKIEEELQALAQDDERLRNTTEFNHDLDDLAGSADGAGFTSHGRNTTSSTTSSSSFRRIST